MNNLWKYILLAVVAGILGLFALGLGQDVRKIPSPLVHRPAPMLESPALDGGPLISLTGMRGKWVLVNFWGSWCVSCIAEHPYLLQLARQVKNRPDFAIVGVDFRDTVEGAKEFLGRHGNPGYRHAFDPEQKVAIEWGVYGAPESFLVDPQGTIRVKHTGPLYPGWFERVALPLIMGGTVPAAGEKKG